MKYPTPLVRRLAFDDDTTPVVDDDPGLPLHAINAFPGIVKGHRTEPGKPVTVKVVGGDVLVLLEGIRKVPGMDWDKGLLTIRATADATTTVAPEIPFVAQNVQFRPADITGKQAEAIDRAWYIITHWTSLSDEEMAEHLGVSTWAVRAARPALGLRRQVGRKESK